MKIQLESGSPSSATHRLTQPSATLNRRYVSRPTNLAIEEAARSASLPERSSKTARPSRLVNLRVHDTDLEAMRAAEPTPAPEPPRAPETFDAYRQPTGTPRILETYQPAELAQQYNYQMVPAQTPADYQASTSAMPTIEPAQDSSFYAPEPAAIYPENPQPTEPMNSLAAEPTYAPIALDEAPQAYANDNYAASTYTPAPSSEMMTVAPSTPMSLAEPTPSTLAGPSDLDTRSLAMSIAADYTAANLSAAMHTIPPVEQTDSLSLAINEQHATKSIDEIARIASEAISSIQAATDPADIARQIESLQAFAAEIKSTNNLPEIIELGDTIEKFIAIASKSTSIQAETTKKAAPKPALSPKATRAASKVTKSTTKMMSSAARPAPKPAARTTKASSAAVRSTRPVQKVAARPVRRPAKTAVHPQLADDKDAALRKALRSVASMDDDLKTARAHTKTRKKGGFKRFMLAFGCAAACVAAIIYFVGSNIPDISVRVAAMQTGIEASYPSYVPRGFSLSDISSEDSKITLTFASADAGTFTLVEEKSSWDSAALLRNYVEPTWQSNYTTTHEQGLTIYMFGSNATWVNGGVLYKINAEDNVLTKKQLRNIVTSIQ